MLRIYRANPYGSELPDPDVFPDSYFVQEFGAGNLRVFSETGHRMVRHYAAGWWTRVEVDEHPKPAHPVLF